MAYGFLSVVPPLVTIILALLLKNVFASLLVGLFLACLILCGGNVIAGLNQTFYGLVSTFESSGNTIVIMSMLLIGALIYMIERTGGIEGFVEIMVKKRGIIKSKRAAAVFTWLLGIVVFTSGSLSCMVTGSVSRPLNDSMRLSHEKAAFLVHTTSTPWVRPLPPQRLAGGHDRIPDLRRRGRGRFHQHAAALHPLELLLHHCGGLCLPVGPAVHRCGAHAESRAAGGCHRAAG